MKRRMPVRVTVLFFSIGLFGALAPPPARGAVTDDEKAVSALDTEYQAAVAKNDAATMDRILADEGGPVERGARRQDRLRAARENRAEGPRLGQHGGRHRPSLGQGRR